MPFPSYGSVLVKLSISQRVHIFNSLVWDEPLNYELQNLASKTRNVILSCGVQLFVNCVNRLKRGFLEKASRSNGTAQGDLIPTDRL